MNWSRLLVALVVLLLATPVFAAEQINRFDVLVAVQTDGDVVVTETLDVTAEGDQIRRGIFRDLPRYFTGDGVRYAFDYDVLGVSRDGAREPYDTETEGNAFRIRIGDEDVLIEHGAHTYELRYRVKNQVRYFADYDEVYWNATGNYWAFPIAAARATIQLPPGAAVTQTAGHTGALGQTGDAFTYSSSGDRHTFETTRALQPGEGLTVAVGFAKGLINPPSSADRGAMWWQRNGALAILIASMGGLLWYLWRSFDRVGRDPVKGPVFPRYDPPRDYSPAAAHHIYYRALNGNRALIATLMSLAVKGRITIDASDKKVTVLTRAAHAPDGAVAPEDAALERGLFAGGDVKTLGQSVDAAFTTLYQSYQRTLGKKYGRPFFRWNAGYTMLALVLSFAAIGIAISQAINWTAWHTLGVIAIAALNGVFMYLMPAPTPMGQEARSEIEGFRLYMETAEKLQVNAVTPGADAPPPMTKERYEKYLPYAVALGVEKPWTHHFERLLPEEAERYNPGWTNVGSSRSLSALSGALVSNMNSGVASAMPQSSGSSGSGGGGSSGGGGGGGGGGGW